MFRSVAAIVTIIDIARITHIVYACKALLGPDSLAFDLFDGGARKS
jgi:hypothetical protein